MTHAICTQSKPSLSVRTRALSSKYYTKRFDRHALLRHSLNSRLRHRSANVNVKPEPSTIDHILRTSLSTSENAAPATNANGLVPNATAYVSDTYVSSSASSVSSSSNSKLCVCKWQGCESHEVMQSQLVTHIQQVHVFPQLSHARRKCFCCLWHGCRVFGRPSVSYPWLEHHVLHHTDAKGKPFHCIFESCNLRFSTSTLLERHVRRAHVYANHSNEASNPTLPLKGLPELNSTQRTLQVSNRPSETATPIKKHKRKKKTRPYRVRRIDFYDTRTQVIIHNRLRISRILNTDLKRLVSETSQVSPTECEVLHGLPSPRLCDQLPMRTRLRSCLNERSLVSSAFQSNDLLSFKNMNDVCKNILLLLTTPHTFIGQRSSEHNRCEFLVRWVGEFDRSELPPSWVFEDELRIAARLEKYL